MNEYEKEYIFILFTIAALYALAFVLDNVSYGTLLFATTIVAALIIKHLALIWQLSAHMIKEIYKKIINFFKKW